MAQPSCQCLSAAGDVGSHRGFGAAEGRGNVVVRRALNEPHGNGHGLLIREAGDGLRDFIKGLVLHGGIGGERLPGRDGIKDCGIGVASGAVSLPFSEMINRRFRANLQGQCLRIRMCFDFAPAFPESGQRGVKCIFGIVGSTEQAPDDGKHLVLNGFDDAGIGGRLLHIRLATANNGGQAGKGKTV